MVLQAYFDDSQDKKGEFTRMQVYAGYVAPKEAWDCFKQKWASCLSDTPAIDYFKMSEAMSGEGEFSRIAEPVRNAKIKWLYEIIKTHAVGATFSAVMLDDFQEVMSAENGVPEEMHNPHFFNFYGIVQNLGKGLELLSLDGPVSFFFDNGNPANNNILKAWNNFREYGPVNKKIIETSPIFVDEKKVLPIQAADYCAWIVREKLRIKLKRGEDKMFLPWEGGEKKAPPFIRPDIIWNKANLLAYIERSKKKNLAVK